MSTLNSVSDETGSMEMSLVSEGSLSRDMLESKDVFVVDTGKALYVWIGNAASPDEKKNAMTYAHVRSKPTVARLVDFVILNCRTI